MLDENQLKLAREKLSQLRAKLQLRLYPGQDPTTTFSRALGEVIEEIVEAADGKLEVVRTKAPTLHGDVPSLSVRNVTYLAIPLEQEFEPFLDLLTILSEDPIPVEGDSEPAKLKILIAPTCPNCPKVVVACARLAASMPKLQLEIIDVQSFSELAGSCRSVPMVIIDGIRTIVGIVSSKELLQILQDRGSPDYFMTSLLSMIEAGRLDEAVPLLVSDKGMAALATMFKDGTMQERMGLMLVVENALTSEPHCLDAALPHLLPLLESDDATLRGDTADLLGQIGAPGAREALTRLLKDENLDVREVALESLDMLRQPS